MTPCRVAVIGAGYFGNWHAQNYAAMAEAELVAVCDSDPARAAAVADAHGTVPETDLARLPGRIDAASVAVPTPHHAAVCGFLLDNGIHVLAEKPVTAAPAEADALIAAAERRGLVLQVGHVERFNAAFLALRPLIRGPRVIECRRLSPHRPRGTDVSIVLDLMIHDIDLVLSLAGADPLAVEAAGGSVVGDRHDFAQARLAFPGGLVADLSASRVDAGSTRTLRICQEDGVLAADLGAARLTVTRREGGGMAVEERQLEAGNSLRRELDSFVAAVRTGSAPVVSGRDGRRALAVATDIMAKIDRGGAGAG